MPSTFLTLVAMSLLSSPGLGAPRTPFPCLLALETVAQGRCLGGYRLQAQPTQSAAVASHWPTPQEERERLLPRHPGMVNLSVEEVVGGMEM